MRHSTKIKYCYKLYNGNGKHINIKIDDVPLLILCSNFIYFKDYRYTMKQKELYIM